MSLLTDNDISKIARRIADAYAPLAVGTFGSYAIGLAHEGSDLDLFIIKKSLGDGPASERSVRHAILSVLHPIDVVVVTAEKFEESVYEYMSFAWVIAKQARLYHWSNEARELLPSLKQPEQDTGGRLRSPWRPCVSDTGVLKTPQR